METIAGSFSRIDAALFYPPTGQIYFFKGKEYVRFTPESNVTDWEGAQDTTALGNGYVVDTKYPRDLAGGWKGLPSEFESGIDATIYTNGLAYFFKNSKYVRFRRTTIDAGYETPKTLLGGWKMDDSFYENIAAAFYYPESKKKLFFQVE